MQAETQKITQKIKTNEQYFKKKNENGTNADRAVRDVNAWASVHQSHMHTDDNFREGTINAALSPNTW